MQLAMTLRECIDVRNVSVRFGRGDHGVHALAKATFTARLGEFVALMGPSGSGKSTLLNVMAGLQVVSGGEVQVAGHYLHEASDAESAGLRLSSIGVVFQDHNLIPEFTVEENIAVPLRARGFNAAQAAEEVERCLDAVGLQGYKACYPSALSGGQQQRVGVARGLAGSRQILLADEPTGSLDSENTRSLFAVLKRLASAGACVVVATHDPEVRNYADRIVSIRDGAIHPDQVGAVHDVGMVK